jgi:hypothetical protein
MHEEEKWKSKSNGIVIKTRMTMMIIIILVKEKNLTRVFYNTGQSSRAV